MTFLPPFYLDFTWEEIFFPETKKVCGQAAASAHRKERKFAAIIVKICKKIIGG